MRPNFSRLNEIHQIRGRLEREGFPRLQMLFLVSITGVAGFLASYLLLHAGLGEMWMRYLVAFGIAYLIFLGLLWMWLRTSASDYSDFPDITNSIPTRGGGCTGKGGEFGGGGASGYFDQPAVSTSMDSAYSSSDTNMVGEAFGAADEFAIPLALLALVGMLLLSSFYVIYSAPILFAELLVDGVLAASLYRRLRGLETRHWLETAIRRTFWPFVLTALCVACAGWVMALYAPGAVSIGDVLIHVKQAG